MISNVLFTEYNKINRERRRSLILNVIMIIRTLRRIMIPMWTFRPQVMKNFSIVRIVKMV